MPLYDVNATISFAAWKTVEADTPEEAIERAQEYPAGCWDFDSGTAELDFNVTPEVSEV